MHAQKIGQIGEKKLCRLVDVHGGIPFPRLKKIPARIPCCRFPRLFPRPKFPASL